MSEMLAEETERVAVPQHELLYLHAEQYRRPEMVVYCWPGDPGGYPYANRQYRGIAEAFAAGRAIDEWNDGGWFKIGGRRFQVVADRNCLDVIRRD